MSSGTMGRRYERLLFWAGPLAFLSVLVMFVAMASDIQGERRQARCLRAFAEVIEQNSNELERARHGEKVAIRGKETDSYWFAIRMALIPWEVRNSECERYVPRLVAQDKILAPQNLIENAKKQAATLEATPLSLYGVDLPDKATLSLLGTPVKMELLTLVRVMQLALGPVLLLWLGSPYHTRHRETLQIAKMSDLGSLYPHIINVYPVFMRGDAAWDSPRKKSWLRYGAELFGFPAFFALTRIALLSAFVGPPVAFYLTGVYVLRGDVYSPVSIGMGLIVGIFAAGNILCEIHLWHVRKRFAAPRRAI